MRRYFFVVLLFSATAISIFGIYFSTQLGDLDIIMPLDDVYIHFQYARQLASGQPYIYNTGEPATSGATSFIYPYILAVGYLLGFQGLNLGIWAMIVGVMALLGAMIAIYRLCYVFDVPFWLSILMAMVFALTGSVSWHAMSGMETMLMVCFSLWTLVGFVEQRLNLLIVFAGLLALTRPEGSIIAVIAVLMFGIGMWLEKWVALRFKNIVLLSVPVLASGVQPLVNFWATGSFSASGSQAKSLLGLIPQDWNVITSRIIQNFVRLWTELFTGYSPSQDLWYLPMLIVPLGLLGLLMLLRKKRLFVLTVVLWLGSLSVAISTLDTAFWHFKRYQLPLMILFVPLSVIPIIFLLKRLRQFRWFVYGLMGIGASLFVAMTFQSFLSTYVINVNYVRYQPYAMAKWLTYSTPEDTIVAVHDVGMMRYMGEHKTLDIVGLTTADAAQYWRNGVGSVAEFLMRNQPDYIASYGRGHGYGLYMLADTRLYGEPLAEFNVDLDVSKNVALAADTQAIYYPQWEAIITPQSFDDVLFDINVADIASEQRASYHWENDKPVDGFATVVYDFDVIGCDISHSQSCLKIDGARQLTGSEQFIANLNDQAASETVLLVTRVHPIDAIWVDVLIDNEWVDTQWIPKNPGHWLDIETRIPTDLLTSNTTITVVPHLDDGELYVPARHTIIPVNTQSSISPEDSLASYQDNHLQLIDYQLNLSDGIMKLTLDWYSDGQTTGDYRFFVHLYDDINQPPVAQWDNYLGKATLPLGNWLDGSRQDTIHINTESLVAGDYQLMIGFYDSATYDRLMPQPNRDNLTIFDDGRLVLQSVEIK